MSERTHMQVGQVLETCLYVDDLEVAETFYSRVLGLRAFARVAGRHVFFHCGTGVFLLFDPDKTVQATGKVPTHGAQGAGHVAFSVPLEAIPVWREHLRQHEVTIEAEVSWPGGGQSIYFRDPAGNSVELATPQVWPTVAEGQAIGEVVLPLPRK